MTLTQATSIVYPLRPMPTLYRVTFGSSDVSIREHLTITEVSKLLPAGSKLIEGDLIKTIKTEDAYRRPVVEKQLLKKRAIYETPKLERITVTIE